MAKDETNNQTDLERKLAERIFGTPEPAMPEGVKALIQKIKDDASNRPSLETILTGYFNFCTCSQLSCTHHLKDDKGQPVTNADLFADALKKKNSGPTQKP